MFYNIFRYNDLYINSLNAIFASFYFVIYKKKLSTIWR